MEGCLLRCSALTSSWSYLHREIRLYSDIDKKLEDMGIFCGDVRAGSCLVLVVLHLPHWFFFQEMIMSFYVDTHPVPDELYAKYPAFVHLGVMSSRMETTYVARKLLTCLKK